MADTFNATGNFDLVAKTFFGLEGVLADELKALGAAEVRQRRRAVAFRGDLRLLVRANVYLRTAVRVLVPIHAFNAHDEAELYRGIGQVDWRAHLAEGGSLAIDPVVRSSIFTNSLYVAQLAKDAIVDQLRSASGGRPSVDLADPDLRLNLHVAESRVTVYLDSSGDSLHKRGYRTAAGEAPLNEVLAAGILRLDEWDERSPLADFMCGSGTLVIEAALAARRIAPGTIRRRFGYMRWLWFDRALDESVLAEARAAQLPRLDFPIRGSDIDPAAIAAARSNAARAGVGGDVELAVENFDEARPPASAGMLVTNPPYDERMKAARIAAVYRRIGETLSRNWQGYTAHVLSGNPAAAKAIGLRPSRQVRLFNGPIECRLLRFDIARQTAEPAAASRRHGDTQAADFANRLARMARHWHRWARRQGITCYRLYDRDIPGVGLAVDWYEGQVVIAAARRTDARTDVEHDVWLERMRGIVAETLGLSAQNAWLARLRGQHAAGADRERTRTVEVHEDGLAYQVHLGAATTGLPLDRRLLRRRIRDEAAGRRVLDLFARAGTFSVAAAAGGASSVVAVDAAPAALDWTRTNLRLNGPRRSGESLICAEPMAFVESLEPAKGAAFDLAVVAPPPGGALRGGKWNAHEEYTELVQRLLGSMSPGGTIYLVSAARRFKLDFDALPGARVREITRQSVPPDFRDKKVHRAWTIVK